MEFTVKNPMPPLWLRYPNFSRFCIGWRMGFGESYKRDFTNWLKSLSQADYTQYKEMFPTPKTWGRDWYKRFMEKGDTDDYTCETVMLWNEHGEQEYSREKLMREYNAGKKHKYIFFWKPNAGTLDKSCFGQWQPSPFDVNAEIFSCTEKYMMSEKASLFDDEETRELIMKSADPKKIKALGREVKNFDQALWDKAKYSIVLNGNYCKFTQNPAMREFLLASKDRVLVEASPLDTIWGIGLGEDNEKAMNPNTWRGLNLLGFALMEVRDEIRKVYKNYDAVDWKEFSK